MSNPATTDRHTDADDTDDYVVVDQRRVILDLPDSASAAATRAGLDPRLEVVYRVPIVRPPWRDDRRGH